MARLLTDFRAGQPGALARTISMVENERLGSDSLLSADVMEPASSSARIGMTGPPGAGKSTLVNQLAAVLLERGQSVGVLAVDPTSPYSGGALLGDRTRISELATEGRFFFRSMASRGSSGGLSAAAGEALEVMDCFGFDWLIVETVGAGQTDARVVDLTDTVVTVLVPESGDEIQALKAGLLETADILLVNKADRPGADRMASELHSMLALQSGPSGSRAAVDPWDTPVILTDARAGEGIGMLYEQIDRHRTHLELSGGLRGRRRRRVVRRVWALLDRELTRRAREILPAREVADDWVDQILSGTTNPHAVVQEMIRRLGMDGRKPRS